MLHIGICDDLADARLVLQSAVERILSAQEIAHCIFQFSSGDRLLAWMEKHLGELNLIFWTTRWTGRTE